MGDDTVRQAARRADGLGTHSVAGCAVFPATGRTVQRAAGQRPSSAPSLPLIPSARPHSTYVQSTDAAYFINNIAMLLMQAGARGRSPESPGAGAREREEDARTGPCHDGPGPPATCPRQAPAESVPGAHPLFQRTVDTQVAQTEDVNLPLVGDVGGAGLVT